MKLTILIRRQKYDEPSPGTLKAYVVQEGKRGRNLLTGSMLSNVETARQRLNALFHEHKVTYEIDDTPESQNKPLLAGNNREAV